MAGAEPIQSVVHITTVPETLIFLKGQLRFLRSRGFDVHAISSPGKYLDETAALEGVEIHRVQMARAIAPLKDVQALVQLVGFVRATKPKILHAHTPKAGLLGMLAGAIGRVPIRIYHIHGLPFVTAWGWKRILLIASERVACRLASRVFAVSHSVGSLAVREGVCDSNKLCVLSHGSINGVDAEQRFNPKRLAETKERQRREQGIPAGAVVIGFVGRLARDKGILELKNAWDVLSAQYPKVHLLIVGARDERDPASEDTLCSLKQDARVHMIGAVDYESMPTWYSVMDMVVLPTYREGFPVVPLEAAAMGLPVVGTAVPGCCDAVRDGITGTLVPSGDSAALSRAISQYLDDPTLRLRRGAAGREWVRRDYRPEKLWQELEAEYLKLLEVQPGQHQINATS